MVRRHVAFAALALGMIAPGCVDQTRPVYEAPGRQTIPIPVCAEGIAPPKRDKGDSSTIVRDVHRWGGDLTHFVPPPVVEALQKK